MVKIVSSPQKSVQVAQSSLPPNNSATIACTICSAQYAPSQAHASLVQAPKIALESAFMSMCHFCFRCRRPACPLCWDDVHSICGACVEEVHLPFRREGEPLPMNSSLLKTTPQRSPAKPQNFPLICVSPGRFHALIPVAERAVITEPVNAAPIEQLSVMPTVPPTPLPKEEHETPPQETDTRPIPVVKQARRGHIWQRTERMVTLLLGIIVFLIAVLIFVASFSQQANIFIAHFLHVDIRMEIEYLLQQIQQNH